MPPTHAAPVRAGIAGSAGGAADSEAGSRAVADNAPAADFADIRTLDISGALQILLAEVRASLDSMLETAAAQGPGSRTPPQAARALVDMYLRALPEDAGDPAEWTAAWGRVDDAVQSSIERALGAVSQWPEVSPPVVNAPTQTRALFLAALDDDPRNPVWMRPEWLSLAPLFHRFRRRRRNALRRLSDPDHSTTSLDDDEGFR